MGRDLMKIEEEQIPQASGTWAFVINRIVIEAELPFELAPNCFINKATKEELDQIKKTIAQFSNFNFFGPEYLYECETVFEETANGGSTHFAALPENEWRYYVVKCPDNGMMNHDLHLASNISLAPLELSGLYFTNLYNGRGSRPSILQNHFHSFPRNQAKRVGQVELNDIKETYQLFIKTTGGASATSDFPEIQRAMQMYDSLNMLPSNSDFHVLGLFAIIEMLITHNPKLEDRGDSITHQMQSKMPLLANRFNQKLDLTSFFKNALEKKIWSAMYQYRSALAHGGIPDFQKTDLKILQSPENAKAFLVESVKHLLKHSLSEPQLFRDLRNC